MSPNFCALGLGLGTMNQKGEILDCYFPAPMLRPSPAIWEACLSASPDCVESAWCLLSPARCAELARAINSAGEIEQARLAQRLARAKGALICALRNDSAPGSVPEAYLKLHLISHRLVKPRDLNLDGLFKVLPNVAWTDEGPIDLNELADLRLEVRLRGKQLQVNSVDKFPQMTNYVVPHGVRIADTARVRLGAYIGEGTTIMHEGFVNFDAGTEGPGMIEGRISAGVFVGRDSDLGGGCSTMGTLSGGGNVVISIGQKCLIGANAGTGIPLGDRCTIEAGLYVTAGSQVSLLDQAGQVVDIIKARELAGQSDLLFRRNSRTGCIECLSNQTAIELNAVLHAHN